MWLGVGIIAFALLGYFVVIPIGIDSPNSVPFLALAPAFWPNIIMALLALLGLVLMVQGVMAIRASAQQHSKMLSEPGIDQNNSSSSDGAGAARPFLALSAMVLLFVYFAALQKLGFVAASMLILPVYMLMAGVRNYLLIGLLSLGLPVALYFFFTTVARVALPLGIFESLLS